MNWMVDWQALSANIKGILDAASFFYRALYRNSADARSEKVLFENAEKTFFNIENFYIKHDSALPEVALNCLKSFVSKINHEKIFEPKTGCNKYYNIQVAFTSLAAFRSEFDYLISDMQFLARRITERAFIHLQRSIVVDDMIRERWKTAFINHETSCEKLGALHLLSHGVGQI